MANVLGSLMKAGIRGKYDPEGRMGHFLYKGYKVTFSIGGENFYFSFPKKVFHTKYAPTQTVKAIMNFLEVISDYS